ncbi:MAG: site-2 protease family protein [Gammaproteobacteria bacterium]|nr:site-2 protease family protein [Gammaproteobacteria bacterium]
MDTNIIQTIAIWVLPVLFAITVHEAAHGWMAKRLGDSTAMMLGRLTLNPIKHIDPIGTILVPVVLLISGSGFLFGWAKPVPVTWENLKNPRRDMALVALAGPASNLIMAIMWAIVAKIAIVIDGGGGVLQPLILMGLAGIQINIILMVLNLLPIPPLDGGRIVTGLLPGPMAWQFSRIEPFGLFILIGLLLIGVLWQILGPIVAAAQSFIFLITGL